MTNNKGLFWLLAFLSLLPVPDCWQGHSRLTKPEPTAVAANRHNSNDRSEPEAGACGSGARQLESAQFAALAAIAGNPHKKPSLRAATFNVSLNRKNMGELAEELATGNSMQAKKIAEVIQRVRPDLILLNEFDYDNANKSIDLFREKYLAVAQNEQLSIEYRYYYSGTVNTGVDSGMDLNNNGTTGDAEDALGFGTFPGQYGMIVLSRFPIDVENVRTFQNFPWHKMPGALRPIDPVTQKPWYDDETWSKLRLSSKSHWDIPVQVNRSTIHFLCSHPTPPVFDGPEDRNGCRNHDEIRMWTDYVSGSADYLVDDAGVAGGLDDNVLVIIAGDMNADPNDGDSRDQAARQLTEHPRLNHSATPTSMGAVEASNNDGGANLNHVGDSKFDTGDFNDQFLGNVRVDYCVPSTGLTISDCGVFWPASNDDGFQLNDGSDHHLVWIDVVFEEQ